MFNNKLTYRNVLVQGNNNVVGIQSVQDEDKRIKDWIKRYAAPIEFTADFPEEHFAPGLRDTVMGTDEFKACLKVKSQTFVLVGGAGIGKTTTIRGILKSLKGPEYDGNSVFVASMFYNWHVVEKLERAGHTQASREAHEPSKVMMRLLSDVIPQVPNWIKFVRQFYRDNQQGCPSAEKTTVLLTSIIDEIKKKNRPACIVVDGVDECKGDQNINTILKHLRRIQEQTGIGLLFTDRLREKSSWQEHFPQLPIHIFEAGKANNVDLDRYIDGRLKSSPIQNFLGYNESLVDDVISAVKEASSAIFLLVHLNVEYIISQEPKTESEIRRNLAEISSDTESRGDIDEVFVGWLERIASDKDQKHEARVARRVIQYVRDAWRPLTVPELQQAITWDLERKKLDGTPREWDDIRRACRGMIQADESGDVRFYHPSLHRSSEDERIVSKLPKSHAELGNICVQYLAQESFSAGACTNESERASHLRDFPLLPYAARFWPLHLTTAFPEDQESTSEASTGSFDADAHELLRADSNVEFSLQMARCEDRMLSSWSQTLQTLPQADATMFHELPVSRIAVGLFDQLQGNIEEFEDFDPFAACRTTGLHLACRYGFSDYVTRLLNGKKACECRDRQLRTPLHVAATFNRADIVKELLEHGVDPDPRDKFGYSPLMSAAQNGAEAVVKLLLAEKDIDINAQTTARCSIYKRSALHMAAARNHLSVARALLADPSIKVDLRDSHGDTPLHLAVKMRNLEMLRYFVEHDHGFDVTARVLCHSVPQDITSCGQCGCNVMHLAALDRSAEPLVKYLLKHFSHLRQAHDYGERIPLHYAVSMEAIANVKHLLKEDAKDQINAKDQQGWPPLIEAINTRNANLFALLWDHPDFRRDMRLNGGQTYKDYAEKRGSDEILYIIRTRSPAPSRQSTLKRGSAAHQDTDVEEETSKANVSPASSRILESPPRASSSKTPAARTTQLATPPESPAASFDSTTSHENKKSMPESPRKTRSRTYAQAASARKRSVEESTIASSSKQTPPKTANNNVSTSDPQQKPQKSSSTWTKRSATQKSSPK